MMVLQMKINDDPTVRVYGAVALDIAAESMLAYGVEVALQQSDWAILARLAAAGGAFVRSGELLAEVWGDDLCDDTPFLRAWIHRLNDKLGAARHDRPVIDAIPGGYRLVAPDEWRACASRSRDALGA